MSNELELLGELTGLGPLIVGRFVTSLLVIFFLWLLHRAIVGLLVRSVEDVRQRYAWQKGAGYFIVVLGIFLIGPVWLEGLRNAATFLGLLSAGLAIAMRDLIINFTGWLFILFAHPFSVGDRIQIGTISGDVIDLRLFQFSLLEIGNWVESDQSTGRVVHVPNGKVFTEPVANYQSGFQYIWNEIPVTVTPDSDWKKARQRLQEIINKHAEHLSEDAQQRVKAASRRFMIFYTNLTPTVYVSVKEKGVQLTVRYLCEPRLRRTTANTIWEEVLETLEADGDIKIVLAG